MSDVENATMRSVRFDQHGEPADVLRLVDTPIPRPQDDRIRVRVSACGLNPADWALCRGLFSGSLPRGIGLEVAGTIDLVGDGAVGARVGDKVFGAVDFGGYPTAGAAEYAVLNFWAPIPDGLLPTHAAALPMATETAYRSLVALGVDKGQTLLVNGAGSTVGFAAVQIALIRGVRVIATAGKGFADRLRDLGVLVTPYGEGLADRVATMIGGAPDLILDTAPVTGNLPDLVPIVDGVADRVLTITDFQGAEALGVRTSGRDQSEPMRYDVLEEFARRAAKGEYTIPIASAFGLDEWREGLDLSLSGHAHGKILLTP